MIYRFEVPGPAIAQARPGSARGRWRYDPPRCREYKEKVRGCAAPVQPPKPFEGALTVKVTEYRAIPRSWSKRKQEAARNGRIDPITKPDTDNVLKGIKDALKGIFWKDDAQVIHDDISKRYIDTPRVEVEVGEVRRE